MTAFRATSTTATSTFAGGLTVDGTTLVVDYSSGKVGIGTTNPGQLLNVKSSSAADSIIRTDTYSGNYKTGYATFSIYESTSPLGGLYLYPSVYTGNNVFSEAVSTAEQILWTSTTANTNLKMGTVGTGNTQLYSNSLPRLTVLGSGGNVGIGNTTPSTKLDVAGDISASGADFNLGTGSATSTLTAALNNLTFSGQPTTTFSGTGLNGQIRIKNTGSPQIYLYGSNDPDTERSGTYISVVNEGTDTNESFWASGVEAHYTGGAISEWIARSTAPTIFYQDNGVFTVYGNTGLTDDTAYTPTQRFAVSPSAGVQVGLSAALIPLTVWGNIGIASSTNNSKIAITGYDNDAEIYLVNAIDENDNLDWFIRTAGGGTASRLQQYFRGFTGLGTTTPYARLSVEGSSALGDSALAGYFIATSTTATSTFAGILSSGSGMEIRGEHALQFSGGNFSSPLFIRPDKDLADDFTVFTFGSDEGGSLTNAPLRMRWTTSGPLSNTNAIVFDSALSSTGFNLDFNGVIYANNFASGLGSAVYPAVTNYTSVNTGMYFPDSTSLGFSTNAGEKMRILQGGNLGIGNTSPSTKLDVAGDISLSGGDFFFGTGSATTTLTTASGNFGISTTSPYARLSVEGSSALGNSALAGYFIATSTTATSTFYGNLDVSGTAALDTLQLGALTFETNAGQVTLAELPLNSDAILNTPQSMAMTIGGNQLFTVYAQAGTSTIGVGPIRNARAIIGTSTATVLTSSNIPYGSLLISDGALCVDNGAGNTCATTARTRGYVYAEGSSLAGLDLAEIYITEDLGLEAGDLIMASSTSNRLVSKYEDGGVLLGVVSSRPGLLLGGYDLSYSVGTEGRATTTVPVALSGRVPVRVTLEGGVISAGDWIVPSLSNPGFGMKATTSGMAIGTALSSWSGGEEGETEGAVDVFLNVQYHFEKRDFLVSPLGDIALALGAGSVGIGTTTPSYKLQVVGEAAAEAFINISTRGAKKDIEALGAEEQTGIMDKLRNLGLSKYRYNNESADAPLRIGLIAEDSPAEILSGDGKGVDLYKLAAFLLAGVKEQDRRLSDLESRVVSLENVLGVGGVERGSAQTIGGVTGFLESLGLKLTNGIASIKNLAVSAFSVGSREKPAGITMYDEETGVPYCVKIKNGVLVSVSGECDGAGASAESADSTQTDTDTDTDADTTSATDTGADITAPTITVIGSNPAQIEIGTSYADPGATVSDTGSPNIGLRYFVDGVRVNQITLNTASSTEYFIEYSAMDNAGNNATSSRRVMIGGPISDPVVESSLPSATTTASVITEPAMEPATVEMTTVEESSFSEEVASAPLQVDVANTTVTTTGI